MDGGMQDNRAPRRDVFCMTSIRVLDAPPLPPSRFVELSGRGKTLVYEQSGPPDAPTLMLLHGLGATAALNWFTSFPALEPHYRVIAHDHRGHGHALRGAKPFTLEDAADDVVALADACGVDRFIAVGYSMGGPIIELLWRRHRERIAGLVFCATSCRFRISPQDHALFASLGVLARTTGIMPGAIGTRFISLLSQPFLSRCDYEGWAREQLLMRDDRAVLEAAAALGTYCGSASLGTIDVPTSVLVHTRDQVVPPARQVALASLIQGATTHTVDADHFAPVRCPDIFVRALMAAINDVSDTSQDLIDFPAAS